MYIYIDVATGGRELPIFTFNSYVCRERWDEVLEKTGRRSTSHPQRGRVLVVRRVNGAVTWIFVERRTMFCEFKRTVTYTLEDEHGMLQITHEKKGT